MAVRVPEHSLPAAPPALTLVSYAISSTASERELHRWLRVLLVPFVLGAVSFAAAIGSGQQWPMIPAFLLGPFALIAGLIYLCLTCDSSA